MALQHTCAEQSSSRRVNNTPETKQFRSHLFNYHGRHSGQLHAGSA